ncbi:hypothetical protein [Leucobacter luti]|uniref:Excreted virulence factor EspC (Type VII ESX diderm) n=1 Tax=Leucobacter luti TaxID=340320 RepID=A0A4R6S6U7_9MICO|nr:hypothetical protein [Leucobacter luti]MCW2288831.1 hypothetical protein [Leucobacter luti]QYM75269.1 hypothetical protein K1X41_11505 [Leucobacter luti]TCK45018.1 hypothetical protein EDF60_0237 [Leucobacter luti]TDP95542.1 hypothetical protein EDF62_0231 [Leucobacter luti]
MGDRLHLPDSELTAAGASLGTAAQEMSAGSSGRPSGSWDSLSGIGGAVDEYLRGVALARDALADAAKTAANTVSGLMSDSAELDAYLAQTVYSGYAVSKGTK